MQVILEVTNEEMTLFGEKKITEKKLERSEENEIEMYRDLKKKTTEKTDTKGR